MTTNPFEEVDRLTERFYELDLPMHEQDAIRRLVTDLRYPDCPRAPWAREELDAAIDDAAAEDAIFDDAYSRARLEAHHVVADLARASRTVWTEHADEAIAYAMRDG